VVEADDAARAELGLGDVDEPAVGDDLRDRLGAEPAHPVRPGQLGDCPAVVAALADLKM
jgi:hypothetical protein